MKRSVRIALVGAAASLAAVGIASATATWSYSGPTGPKKWATLSADWEKCGNTEGQTPINLRPTPADLPDLEFAYDDPEAEVFNNGHTIEAEVPETSTNSLTIGDTTYDFLQMHFHAPSEHKFRGRRYPVEVHFVNKFEDTLAVVGVFIKVGKNDNPAWEPFIEHLGVSVEDGNVPAEIDFDALLPANRRSIQYTGSLTTPPCSDGVKWNVMSTVVRLSPAQISAFRDAYMGNNRPIQRTAGRSVLIDNTYER